MATLDPYDELPYRSLPIEWTAPERLALASVLHGGPRQRLSGYRVLELGCGDGANLLPLAFYRRHGSFVGVDRAGSQIERAETGRVRLGLCNVEFICADFLDADQALSDSFDFIIAHGVFSWVPHHVRDALLHLCRRRLRPGGLLYLNYNAHPGWKIRGMVRDFVLAHTAGIKSLSRRARSAQDASAMLTTSLGGSDHPYCRLLADEFRFLAESDTSYVAHEYLTGHNYAYWRREFLELVGLHGLEFVADADFNYSMRGAPDGMNPVLQVQGTGGLSPEDTHDFLSYRQLHSPVLTTGPLCRVPVTPEEFGSLFAASSLKRCAANEAGERTFEHPTGYRVEAKDREVERGLEALENAWPCGVRVREVFPDYERLMEDLILLHRNGLVELRIVECDVHAFKPDALHGLEAERTGYVTTPYHSSQKRHVRGPDRHVGT
jgi:SAM-dependent methyltransferase